MKHNFKYMTHAIIYHTLYMLYNIKKIEHTMYQVDTHIYTYYDT